MYFKSNIFLIVLVYIVHTLLPVNTIDVNTTSGVVRGLTIDVLNTTIDQFLAIPYAEPPVGSLRFAKPEPIRGPSPVSEISNNISS